ncbi:MAG: M14 family zinc carboxypeptidase, partial [Victivallaceae bacterium]|nr:M14 family zinc carboxypeptidase [Victivallaceae bacterium]
MENYENKYFPEIIEARKCQWPGLEDIKRFFDRMVKEFSGLFSYEEIGLSVENRPVYCARITNSFVPDTDKQVIMFIAAEHGDEKSATGTVLKIIEWLISPEAKETVDKQIIYLVPAVNVDGYVNGRLLNSNGKNLFADYNYDGLPPGQPESESIWRVLEEITPDAFFSLHGLSEDWDSLGYPRTWESTDVSFTSQYERCYNRKFIERINAAAEKAGYMQDRGEEDIERILPLIPAFEYHSFPSFEHYACSVSYCYNRFHSLSSILEIGPVASGFLRCREILQIGNGTWEYECYPGYPNRIITCSGIPRNLL